MKPPNPTLFDTEARKPSKSELIVQECLRDEEPFFVLRAKDIFSVMGVHNYLKLVEEFGPVDFDYQEGVARVAITMREWQTSHPARIKYPD
ncbi:hypothetical protein LCGC14_1383590 [marine sediment metagenome]|uniref:Uncharacterized protein n=1 Tax=marine sediment metagenome TaxID=412755 RepID=A0A0F9KMU1_9ZZZZ